MIMKNTTIDKPATLTSLRAFAAAQVARWPQYDGHFASYRLARVKRSVTTKAGRAFKRGEIVIAVERTMFPESMDSDAADWTVTAWSVSNAVDTSLRGSDVEWL